MGRSRTFIPPRTEDGNYILYNLQTVGTGKKGLGFGTTDMCGDDLFKPYSRDGGFHPLRAAAFGMGFEGFGLQVKWSD